MQKSAYLVVWSAALYRQNEAVYALTEVTSSRSSLSGLMTSDEDDPDEDEPRPVAAPVLGRAA